MKLTVKTLITLVVAGSALLLTPTKSHAQVNMTTLAEVAKSCQKDAVSRRYYQQMLLRLSRESSTGNAFIELCIRERYHFSLVLEQFPGLSSGGEIIRGYPGSVVVGLLAARYKYGLRGLLDCLISEDASSDVCSSTRYTIAAGVKLRCCSDTSWDFDYLIYVCPSCVVAHDEVSGSQTVILRAFMKWFLTLDKSERRQVMSLLGDEDNARNLRRNLSQQSNAAIAEYREARARVEQQERERRRQELLGL
ncbi:hypothetical protein NWP21_07385 [Anabaenopsis sp. FSS-46]|uniref:hypothetical protein n=1 Tax=Anabaenopsis sp. FSS-46 TaxID=2971766 RepID=UPI0024753F82|nr:hypothetical protein [Anabaenopsis sp. FSS-46]MDH6098664.1 hypothetical protein [Anabaenopsis sp. FSS-46]